MRPIGVIKSYQLPLTLSPALDCPLIYEPVRPRLDWCVGGRKATKPSARRRIQIQIFDRRKRSRIICSDFDDLFEIDPHEDLFRHRDREISFNFSRSDRKCRRSPFKGRLGTLLDSTFSFQFF